MWDERKPKRRKASTSVIRITNRLADEDDPTRVTVYRPDRCRRAARRRDAIRNFRIVASKRNR
jgi:hypothetical protein